MLKKFKVLFVIASFAITLSLMSNTYSRYVASSEGNFQVEFAKWQLLVNNTDITNQTVSNLSFEPTIEKNENIAENTVAPSSTGYFDIEIDPSNVDVSFKYNITLEMDNENIPDLMITKYAIIPDDYNVEDGLKYVYLNNNETYSITQEVKYGDKDFMTEETVEDKTTKHFKPIKIRVFFEWIEGTSNQLNDSTGQIEKIIEESMSNEDDTSIGINAANNNNTFTVTANIGFEQIIA